MSVQVKSLYVLIQNYQRIFIPLQ